MPIGALTSQLLGNVGLHPPEAVLRERFPELEHVRQMDDFIVFGPTKARLWAAHAAVAETARGLGLALKGEATRLAPASEGVAFLGYRVYAGALHLVWSFAIPPTAAHPARPLRRWPPDFPLNVPRVRLREKSDARLASPRAGHVLATA